MDDLSDERTIDNLLRDWHNGDSKAKEKAKEELFKIIYPELHKLAESRFKKELRKNHTLQITALVNEAYIKLDSSSSQNWKNLEQFYCAAATVMREILVDYARYKGRGKRRPENGFVPFDELSNIHNPENGVDLIALNEAIEKLYKVNKEAAIVFDLRFFGLTNEEIAGVMKVTISTVKRRLNDSIKWLKGELER